MRRANIPVFVPHRGCPCQCVFCDQRQIAGESDMTPDRARAQIESCLATLRPDVRAEIAFFGGSFTGIARAEMIAYLDAAQSYVDGTRVDGIRLSTRPDYITPEILQILSRYAVRHIELGIQSLDDRVLAASGRGHTAQQSLSACRAVRDAGSSLVGQMMIGLPASTLTAELETARGIAAAGATAARVYPTAVLRGTRLAEMTEAGSYVPLTCGEAVERTAAVLEQLDADGVDVLRVGLCETEQLRRDAVLYGGYHAAMGELARSEVFYRRQRRAFLAMGAELHHSGAEVFCPRGKASQVAGQHGRNRARLMAEFDVKWIKITEIDALTGYGIACERRETEKNRA